MTVLSEEHEINLHYLLEVGKNDGDNNGNVYK